MAKILEKEKGRRGDTCHILQGEYNAFDSESIPLYCYRFSYLDIHCINYILQLHETQNEDIISSTQ